MTDNRIIVLPEPMNRLLANVAANTAPFLERILITFPQYTDHGPTHSQRIINLFYDVVLDADNRTYLEKHPWTHFFLLASAYLHDIGMVAFPELHSESPHEIRNTHAIRGVQIIRQRWSDFGLENLFQARVVAEIIKHHTGPLEPRHFVATRSYGTETVNVGFCIACLRLADELDLPQDRASRRLVEFIQNQVSSREWETHYSIGGVTQHPSLRQTVQVECCCQNKEVHRKLKSLETKINKLLSIITAHVDPRLPFTQCVFEIESDGYIDKDLKFTIDENSLWPMIVGDILYHDNRIFIRELVQNAIDACLLRSRLESDYSPSISVSYNRTNVTVVDNGIGMDMNVIEKYLVRICLSFYSSERFVQENESLHYFPISRFGIGIFSCFMVSDEVCIKTSTGSGKTFYLTVRDCRDYVHIEDRDEFFKGTQVTVKLRDNISDVILFVRDTFRYTDLEILYSYPSGDNELIGRRPFSKEELIAFGKHEYDNAVQYEIPFAVSKGYLWYFDKAPSDERYGQSGSFLLLMNGVKVGYFPLLPGWCTLRHLEGAINLRNEERIDITASRNDVIRNKKYNNLVSHIEETLLHVLRDHLTPIAQNPTRVREYFRSAVNATRATSAILPLIKDFYQFQVHPVRRKGKRYKRIGKPKFETYASTISFFENKTKEELLASLEYYDVRLLNLGLDLLNEFTINMVEK